jgi:hypothetical protein
MLTQYVRRTGEDNTVHVVLNWGSPTVCCIDWSRWPKEEIEIGEPTNAQLTDNLCEECTEILAGMGD